MKHDGLSLFLDWPMLLGVVVLFWGAFLLIGRRLEYSHSDLWVDLGQFSLLNWSRSNFFKLLRFVAFSAEHRALNDSYLNKLIWAARVLSVLLIAAIAYAIYVQKSQIQGY